MGKFLIICLTLMLASCSDFLSTKMLYQCSGEFTRAGDDGDPVRLFLKLTKYGSIVSLWSDSDGSLHTKYESKQLMLGNYYPYIKIVGNQFQVYKDHESKQMAGYFSLLSNVISLDGRYGLYDGHCVEKNSESTKEKL